MYFFRSNITVIFIIILVTVTTKVKGENEDYLHALASLSYHACSCDREITTDPHDCSDAIQFSDVEVENLWNLVESLALGSNSLDCKEIREAFSCYSQYKASLRNGRSDSAKNQIENASTILDKLWKKAIDNSLVQFNEKDKKQLFIRKKKSKDPNLYYNKSIDK